MVVRQTTPKVLWSEMRASSSAQWMVCARLAEEYSPDATTSTLSVWNLTSMRHLCDFEGIYDGGGRRIAISPNGELVAGAAYHGGVAVYDCSGKVLWQDNKRKAQLLDFWDDSRLGVGRADPPYELRDARTGEIVAKLRGIEKVFPASPGGRIIAVDGGREVLRIVTPDGRFEREHIPMTGWAPKVAYHPTEPLAYINEADGQLRCICLETFEVRWSRPFEKRSRSWLVYDDGVLIAFLFDPNTAQGKIEITDSETGALVRYVDGDPQLRNELVVENPLRRVYANGDVYKVNREECRLVTQVTAGPDGGYDVSRR